MGMLHPDIGRDYGLKQDVALAEINLEPLIRNATLFKLLNLYPPDIRLHCVIWP